MNVYCSGCQKFIGHKRDGYSDDPVNDSTAVYHETCKDCAEAQAKEILDSSLKKQGFDVKHGEEDKK